VNAQARDYGPKDLSKTPILKGLQHWPNVDAQAQSNRIRFHDMCLKGKNMTPVNLHSGVHDPPRGRETSFHLPQI